MPISQIQKINATFGVESVPDASPYDRVSPGWSEIEHGTTIGNASVAYWEGESGWAHLPVWPYNEVCVMLSGRVTIEDEHGERASFVAGDAFLVPQGFNGVWHTDELSRKIYIGIPA